MTINRFNSQNKQNSKRLLLILILIPLFSFELKSLGVFGALRRYQKLKEQYQKYNPKITPIQSKSNKINQIIFHLNIYKNQICKKIN
jgi:heme/copper-type cytochrome/quinol oxidase subunit 1